jgi:hypothetical protein
MQADNVLPSTRGLKIERSGARTSRCSAIRQMKSKADMADELARRIKGAVPTDLPLEEALTNLFVDVHSGSKSRHWRTPA